MYEEDKIYLKDSQGEILAEIFFPEVEDGVVDINHTFVDNKLRGRGIASELMIKAVTKIQDKGLKVIASCPYAQKWFEKNNEYSYILKS